MHSLSFSQRLTSRPILILRHLLLVWLAIFTITRFVLFFASMRDWIGHTDVAAAGLVFLRGLVFDLGFLAYAAIPMGLMLLLVPTKAWDHRHAPIVLKAVTAISIFLMLFFATSEWFFWDEFGARFNFIAVDYLVYSEEVISNIRESYPLIPILSALAMLAVVFTMFIKNSLTHSLQSVQLTTIRDKLSTFAVLLVPAIASFVLLNQDSQESGGNTYLRELSGNGPYQFFAAFRNNTLDYDQFYANLDSHITAGILRHEIRESDATFTTDNNMDIHRQIDNPGKPAKHNVVLVTIESFSAKYMGSFGDKRALTPNLDALRQHLVGGSLPDGTPLSAEAVATLACDAEVLPAIFDTTGQPLWLGRSQRLATSAQRAAVTARDRGCIVCGTAAEWCQVHHINWWSQGGKTDLDNLCLLCSKHHHRVHEHGLTISTTPEGFKVQPRSIRPVPIQPSRSGEPDGVGQPSPSGGDPPATQSPATPARPSRPSAAQRRGRPPAAA